MGFVDRNVKRWPNGVIPIERGGIFRPVPLGTKSGNLALELAIEEFRSKTAIEIVDKKNQSDYVMIYDTILYGGRGYSMKFLFEGGPGGFAGPGLFLQAFVDPIATLQWLISWIPDPGYGRKGGRQDLGTREFTSKNSTNAAEINNIIHEFGHVIGLLHEHQRPDRASAVNVTMTDPFNFDIMDNGSSLQINDYDCDSVMNYAAGVDPGPICKSEPGYQTVRRKGKQPEYVPILSDGDVKSINFLYPIKVIKNEIRKPYWKLSQPFRFLGRSFVFKWHPGNGEAVLSEFHEGGETSVWKGRLLNRIQNISNILVLFTKNGNPAIFLYEKGTGKFLLLSVSNSAKISIQIELESQLHFRDWTHFSEFKQKGEQYFLAYSNISGRVRIYRMSGDGRKLFTTKWRSNSNWSLDWSNFNFFSQKNNIYLLAYKRTTGQFSLSKLNAFGSDPDSLPSPLYQYIRVGERRIHSGLYQKRDWDTYRTYAYMGKNYLFCHSSKTGEIHIWEISTSTWKLVGETIPTTSNVAKTDHLAGEFFPYMAQDTNGKDLLWFLRYNANDGETTFGRIYAT